MITLRPLAPPHCPARPGQYEPCIGFSLKKVYFGRFCFKSSKSLSSRRHRLASYPCILPTPYYNTVKELSHLNQFCASYRSRSAKSKIQKCSRHGVVRHIYICKSNESNNICRSRGQADRSRAATAAARAVGTIETAANSNPHAYAHASTMN